MTRIFDIKSLGSLFTTYINWYGRLVGAWDVKRCFLIINIDVTSESINWEIRLTSNDDYVWEAILVDRSFFLVNFLTLLPFDLFYHYSYAF